MYPKQAYECCCNHAHGISFDMTFPTLFLSQTIEVPPQVFRHLTISLVMVYSDSTEQGTVSLWNSTEVLGSESRTIDSALSSFAESYDDIQRVVHVHMAINHPTGQIGITLAGAINSSVIEGDTAHS